MARKYTKKELLEMAALAGTSMATFYREGFLNYTGVTKDTEEYDTEVIARWCLDHLERFEEITSITRESPYQVGHDGVYEQEGKRQEEHLAKSLFQKELPLLGKILDYQVPLKNHRDDEAGKIDLLAYNDRDHILRILELKIPKLHEKEEETMLRCILEGYTYLRVVDQKELLKDFGLPEDTEVKASPLVFRDSRPFREMTAEDRPALKELAEKLDCQPFYITAADRNDPGTWDISCE